MRRSILIAAMLATSPFLVPEALAQTAQNGGGFMNHFMGWGGGLMMILIWGAIIFLLFVLARSVNAMHHSVQQPRTAIEILKERFARGEINKEEFEEKRDILMR